MALRAATFTPFTSNDSLGFAITIRLSGIFNFLATGEATFGKHKDAGGLFQEYPGSVLIKMIAVRMRNKRNVNF